MAAPNRYGSNLNQAALTYDVSDQNGCVIITGTVRVAGNFTKIEALTAAVIASLESEGSNSVQGTKTAISLSALGKITGNIQAVTLTSGFVAAYY